MAGRKNRGMLRLIAEGLASQDDAAFAAIDRIIEETMAFRLPGEEDAAAAANNTRVIATSWRPSRAKRPHCDARS